MVTLSCWSAGCGTGHHCSPKFLSKQRQRAEFMAGLGLLDSAGKPQLNWQLVTTLRVIGDERRKSVEAVFRSFERVGGAVVVDFNEVVLDVGPLVRWKAYAEGSGV